MESPEHIPLISVVMPCYNIPPEALHAALSSVRAQTYPRVEIIVTDDGSDAPETVSALDALEPTSIRLIRQSNKGVSAALNAAIAASNGTYFMPLNDDLIDAPYISEAVTAMERDANLGIVYCRADFFGSKSGPWLLPPFSMKRQLTDNCIFATALFRRADWERCGGYDETMRSGREDHDFVLRILGLGRTVRRLDATYFHYRQGDPTSVNSRVGADRSALIQAHTAMLRNNKDLYAEHADLFWERYFELVDERNDLAARYRVLERARRTPLGRKVWSAVRAAHRAATWQPTMTRHQR